MRTLLYAAILYLIGIVVILLLRPSLMFDDDGNWKEFGIVTKAHSIFPFWLFCITWAVLSYCITLYFTSSGERTSSSRKHAVSDTRKEIFEPESEDLIQPLPPVSKRKNVKSGYYVLNVESTKNGKPKYIYYGETPPEVFNEE
jgi:hypothetical protein